MARKILFVVHRYAPYPGGSETNVKNMAEEMLRRGYDVTVLALTNAGDLNGVKVTNDHAIAFRSDWDMIIVHGGDVPSQDFVHLNMLHIRSSVLYLIIKPSRSKACLNGLVSHDYLGWGTSFDLELIKEYDFESKARFVRYGIDINDTLFLDDPLEKNTTQKTFISIGGFAPHKQMRALYEAFIAADIPDANLVLLGYDGGDVPDPDPQKRVYIGTGLPKRDVMRLVAVSDALIMNSSEEGFGLILLEAMMNKTPWIARDIAGAHDMQKFGTVYNTEQELMDILRNFERDENKVQMAYNYVMGNHTISHCADDLERIIDEEYN
jgi:glycosyltransferase involved in cell wall biosynthesis